MYKRIDFSKLEGLATYQDTLDFLQISYRDAIGAVARAFGSKVIVTGVTDLGTAYSDGWVIIDGELMPFTGGLKSDRIVVEEQTGTEMFNDGSNQTVYYTKRAKSGVTGGFTFTDFIWVDSMSALTQGLKNLLAAHNNLLSAFSTHTHSWNDITNKPSTFNPSYHRHNWSDIDNKPANTILWANVLDFGDIGNGGDDWTWVRFPSVNTIRYIVAGSLLSKSPSNNPWNNWPTDNHSIWTVKDKEMTQFKLMLQDVDGGVQNLQFEYALISY